MSVTGLFILDRYAKPLLWRKYKPNVSLEVIGHFPSLLRACEDDLTPIIYDEEAEIHFIYVKKGSIYYVVMSPTNSNVTVCFEFLYRLISIFMEYFNVVEESVLLDNLGLVYEILDEVMDSGVPQTTEARVLKQHSKPISKMMSLITKKPSVTTIPASLTNSVSWRSEGISYKTNLCFVDVIEYNNVLINSNGSVVHNYVTGKIKLNTKLSGMPELRLSLSEKVIFRNNKLSDVPSNEILSPQNVYPEDVKFHQSVSLGKFDSQRVIKFIPPDGEFELMTYRILLDNNKPPIQLEVSHNQRGSTLSIELKLISQHRSISSAKFVEIAIPVPFDILNAQMKASIGRCRYDPNRNCLLWNIRGLMYNRTYYFGAEAKLPTVQGDNSQNKAPIIVAFDIVNLNLSGIHVRSLNITEKSNYSSTKWIRYSTCNGEYHIRI